jgi:hypothetical protein
MADAAAVLINSRAAAASRDRFILKILGLRNRDGGASPRELLRFSTKKGTGRFAANLHPDLVIVRR